MDGQDLQARLSAALPTVREHAVSVDADADFPRLPSRPWAQRDCSH